MKAQADKYTLYPSPASGKHRNPLMAWIFAGQISESHAEEAVSHQEPWYRVMWLTGVDYFSSLAYQAGIALVAAGVLAPVATGILVLVTLACAVPVYREVSRRSYAGLGSIAMLEHILRGWWSKLFVLVLLGFAGTDFVITMTLSAADSARHAVENPLLKPYIGHLHLAITIALLVLLALVFLRGFGEAIRLAIIVAIPFVLLNCIVIVRCALEVIRHPELLRNWQAALSSHGDSWSHILGAAVLVFPALALGLSGFETGVAVMPLVRGDREDEHGDGVPRGRIRNTGKLLLGAAALMSVLLLSSSMVTTLLIPAPAYHGGEASGRALAYLAHLYLGHVFGTVYDISTILILWFAGASAMAGLLQLIPRYLPRLGMAPQWAGMARPLVIVLFAIDLVVTLVFRGSVEHQAGAYATGVLVLILSASIASALSLWQEARSGEPTGSKAKALYCGICAVVFAYTLVVNVKQRPDGIIIATIFITLLIASSIASRYHRATELRVQNCTFNDGHSEQLWKQLSEGRTNVVPIATLDAEYLDHLRERVRTLYKVTGPLTFVHVEMLDDRSEFYERLCLAVAYENDDYLVTVSGANVIANTLVYISLALKARAVFMHLAEQRYPLNEALKYALLGTGEVGLMVYEILTAYWKEQPAPERPLLFLMAG
jgi:hypothetical protein